MYTNQDFQESVVVAKVNEINKATVELIFSLIDLQ
jgi:hypothetical protein